MELIFLGISVFLQLRGVHAEVQQQWKTFETGQNVSLLCSNLTVDELIMEVWNIMRTDGDSCRVTWHFENKINSTCDSKITIQNESNRVNLRISYFDTIDEGNYSCEIAFNEGIHMSNIHVNAASADNPSGAHQPQPREGLTLIVCSLAVLLTLIVFTLIIIRRKSQSKVRIKGTPRRSEIFMPTDEEDIMEIDPYITYTENINVIYGY